MNRLASSLSPADTPPGSEETLYARDPERTVQLPILPSGDSPVRITPGGMRRDWRLARHFSVGVVVVALVVALLARQPVAPAKVVLTPSAAAAAKPSRAPAVPPPLPAALSSSVPIPSAPAMFQAPPSGTSFAVPPSNSAPVEPPLALRSHGGAVPPFASGRAGFAVPPAVPLPADSIAFRLHR